MAKDKNIYVCNACGGTSSKWLGKCPDCGAWNSLQESVATDTGAPSKNRFQGLATPQPVASLSSIEASDFARLATTIDELDRVLGGGLVDGGVVLIGGDPGIGKSTLLLQALHTLSLQNKTLYVSGEESGAQIAMRARRLGLDQTQVRVLAEISLERIIATVQAEQPRVCVIDSIQTIYSSSDISARLRCPSAGMCGPPHPTRQVNRRHGDLGRPRDQRGNARWPTGARTHGRHGFVFRRRHALQLPFGTRH